MERRGEKNRQENCLEKKEKSPKLGMSNRKSTFEGWVGEKPQLSRARSRSQLQQLCLNGAGLAPPVPPHVKSPGFKYQKYSQCDE